MGCSTAVDHFKSALLSPEVTSDKERARDGVAEKTVRR